MAFYDPLNNDQNQEMNILKSILKTFAHKYPTLRDVEIQILPKDLKIKHCGYCDLTPYGDFVVKGKNRFKKIRPTKINVWHNNDLDRLIFTFLHEMSHAITDYCERRTTTGLWVVTDHNRQFYENFFTITNLAYDYKFTKNKFKDVETLKKRNSQY